MGVKLGKRETTTRDPSKSDSSVSLRNLSVTGSYFLLSSYSSPWVGSKILGSNEDGSVLVPETTVGLTTDYYSQFLSCVCALKDIGVLRYKCVKFVNSVE